MSNNLFRILFAIEERLKNTTNASHIDFLNSLLYGNAAFPVLYALTKAFKPGAYASLESLIQEKTATLSKSQLSFKLFLLRIKSNIKSIRTLNRSFLFEPASFEKGISESYAVKQDYFLEQTVHHYRGTIITRCIRETKQIF